MFFRLPIGSWEYACGAVKKFSCAAFLSCVLWSALPLASRDDPTTQSPRVTIHFPVGVLSEKVFIAYQLVGPFGGFSQYISPHPDVTSYSFSTSVEGKPAASAKIVVYAPECKFKSFELELSPSALRYPHWWLLDTSIPVRLRLRIRRFGCPTLPIGYCGISGSETAWFLGSISVGPNLSAIP